jgi:hypothetical protein
MLPILLIGEDTRAGDAPGAAWPQSARWPSVLAVLRSVRCCAIEAQGSRPSSVGCPRKSIDFGRETVQNSDYRAYPLYAGARGALAQGTAPLRRSARP